MGPSVFSAGRLFNEWCRRWVFSVSFETGYGSSDQSEQKSYFLVQQVPELTCVTPRTKIFKGWIKSILYNHWMVVVQTIPNDIIPFFAGCIKKKKSVKYDQKESHHYNASPHSEVRTTEFLPFSRVYLVTQQFRQSESIYFVLFHIWKIKCLIWY